MGPRVRLPWSGREASLPAPLRRAWAASLPYGRARLLTAAPSVDTDAADGGVRWLVLSDGWLSVPRDAGSWRHTPWHEVLRGGWQDADQQLHWTLHSGRHGSIHLAAPARVPEVFRERVHASIALEQVVPVTAGQRSGTVVVSARRDLTGASRELSWHTDLQRGLTWSAPGVREAADAALARFRAEFDPS